MSVDPMLRCSNTIESCPQHMELSALSFLSDAGEMMASKLGRITGIEEPSKLVGQILISHPMYYFVKRRQRTLHPRHATRTPPMSDPFPSHSLQEI